MESQSRVSSLSEASLRDTFHARQAFSDEIETIPPSEDQSFGASHPSEFTLSTQTTLTNDASGHSFKLKQATFMCNEDSPQADEKANGNTEQNTQTRHSKAQTSMPEESSRNSLRIHWLSPTLMIASLIAGLLLSIGHHLYYGWLNEQRVGGSNRQQWSLRIGNAFSILVNVLLKAAVGIAYVQYLWKTLRLEYLSLSTINDAFCIGQNLFAFLNWELLSRVRVGVFLALIFWVLPLASLFPPATLSVVRGQIVNTTEVEALSIAITQPAWIPSFYDPYGRNSIAQNFQKMISGIAVTGELPQLVIPERLHPGNVSYKLNSSVPLLRCNPANETVKATLTNFMVETKGDDGPFPNFNETTIATSTLTLDDSFDWKYFDPSRQLNVSGGIGYFGIVPYRSTLDDNTTSIVSWWNASQRANITSLDTLGQLWIALANYEGKSKEVEFINCELYNASLGLDVTFNNGVSTVQLNRKEWMEPIIPSLVPSNSSPPDLVSYSTFFVEVCSYWIGAFAWSKIDESSDHPNSTFTVRTNELMSTNLIFHSQVNNMRSAIMEIIGEAWKGYVPYDIQNITLSALVEEFALNSTLGMLSNWDFWVSDYKNVTASITTAQNVYFYESRSLIISYALATVASATAVIIGIYALCHNGVGYDSTVSTFAVTMQNPKVKEIFEQHPGGALPLDEKLAKIKLRFKAGEGFVLGKNKRGV